MKRRMASSEVLCSTASLGRLLNSRLFRALDGVFASSLAMIFFLSYLFVGRFRVLPRCKTSARSDACLAGF